jgi:DNA-binding NtrC family response regulator
MLALDGLAHLRGEVKACVIGDSPFLILGESGTGKTALASAIAKASGVGPVVRATLGSSDDLNTITSELFGHEKGSFSGALKKRVGLVEYASGGTLILDEILSLVPLAQQLLLDLTQYGTYRPLGYQGQEPKQANVRLIAATNGDLQRALATGRFRKDLYFRLAGVQITLPPLRERRQDILPLAERFLHRLDPLRPWTFSPSAEQLLLSEEFMWDGNIRQLQAAIQHARDRALSSSKEPVIEAEHLSLPSGQLGVPPDRHVPLAAPLLETISHETPQRIEEQWRSLQSQRSLLDRVEAEIIDKALQKNRGIVAHAARQLGISRTSLLSRISTLGIDKSRHKESKQDR